MLDLFAYMQREWDRVRLWRIKIVSFPLPPTPVGKIMYMPSSFNSRTFDTVFDRPKEFTAVIAKSSKWGPAILAYVPLENLIKYKKDSGLLCVPHSTICANVSYYPLFTGDNGLTYATDVVLDRVNMSSRSCHPGSHYAAPRAPYLTALLQYAQAPTVKNESRTKKTKIEYASPDEAEVLFPGCDFSSNRWIDNFIGTCAVSSNVSYFRTTSGPGFWAKDYLKDLRHNILLKEHEREQKQRRPSLLGHARQEDDREPHRQRDRSNELGRQVQRELQEKG